jgi:hypothetical protein
MTTPTPDGRPSRLAVDDAPKLAAGQASRGVPRRCRDWGPGEAARLAAALREVEGSHPARGWFFEHRLPGFVDQAGEQGLLGQVDGRTTAAVRGWLEQRSAAFRAGVQVVVIHRHAGYARAVRELLPHAVLAVDHFHLVLDQAPAAERGWAVSAE